MSSGEPAAGGSVGTGPAARTIAFAGLLGLLVGFLWGIADVPRYSASATVVISPTDSKQPDPSRLERFAQLGASAQVASLAAGLLGGDVAGADLLADVSVAADSSAGAVEIRASAESPDFAAAAANAYAEALVGATGKSLELGAAADLPDSPSENRSAPLWSLLGLLAGVAGGTLAVLLAPRPRRRREPQRRQQAPPAGELEEPEAIPIHAEDAFGVSLLASFGDPEELIVRTAAGVEAEAGEERALADLAGELALDAEGAPRTLAVLDADSGAGSQPLALGLALAAVELGLRVLLVEADLRHPGLAERVGVPPSPGLRDYLRGDAAPREVLRSVRAPAAGGTAVPLICVPAGGRRADLPAGIAGARFDALVERLPRVYDLVLFLAPPVLDDDDATVVGRAVEGVVLVSADDEEAGARIARSLELLEPARLLAGILTRPKAAQALPQPRG